MELRVEEVLTRVRAKLNEDRVKLWLPPYFQEEPVEAELEQLAQTYSEVLEINRDHCLISLHELQNHALDRLKQRNQFLETGVATLRVRIPNQSGGTTISSIQIPLMSLGTELKDLVAREASTSSNRIKLICQGKVLRDELALNQQNIKNGMQIMAVILYGRPGEMEKDEREQEILEKTRADLNILAGSRNLGDELYMQVEDQHGNTMNLPAKERKALVKAMAFHEKGRAALKREDYSLALVLLLEADNEFSCCTSEILKSVDNYALLNLDIAWCYLCLKSVGQLPDAEERLTVCEENFHRSYGPNLERLIALKGNIGNEAALFMRLHLLQAIVLYHSNRRAEARLILERAENELAQLKVDDASVTVLVELGYSPAEARIGLRATHGDVNAAAEYIRRNREEREESRKKAALDEKLNRARRRLGRCADGKQWVEPNLLTSLMEMGYPKEIAVSALQQTNNSISESVTYIQEHPELIEIAMASTSSGVSHKSLVEQIVSMGFDKQLAKAALKMFSGNLAKAVEELTAGGLNLALSDDDDDEDSASTSVDTSKKEEAFSRVAEGLSMVDDDHLDLTLVQEEIFLNQYKKLLQD